MDTIPALNSENKNKMFQIITHMTTSRCLAEI